MNFGKYAEKVIDAAILPQYTKHGAPLSEYGKFVHANFGKHL